MADDVGSVEECWIYPVKSMQGCSLAQLEVRPDGVAGDRAWGLLEAGDGHLLSAKRYRRLLDAVARPESIELPDGQTFAYDDPGVDRVLSEWLGVGVRLRQPVAEESLNYKMTFDPPNDDAELVDIATPEGSFVDLAAVHVLSTATLRAAAAARPDLNWDMRRFRPNLLIESEGAGFEENGWVGGELHVGSEVVLRVTYPTVRCAMPLRSQPALGKRSRLEREAGLFEAMNELNAAHPNHLGAYAEVLRPGSVTVGDKVAWVAAH